jgi:phenylacetate-CoA ligase
VLTSLGRYGAPVFRYRTGDVVRAARESDGRSRFVWLPDGVVGRADNMVTIRGVNIFPSSIEAIVRELPQVSEYRVVVTRAGELDQLRIEIEAEPSMPSTLEKLLSTRLGLRIPVQLVEPASLPRSELKSRRWLDGR